MGCWKPTIDDALVLYGVHPSACCCDIKRTVPDEITPLIVSMNILYIVNELQGFYVMSLRSFLGLIRKPVYLRDLIEQMDYVGTGSFFIVFFVSLFIGMALTLQSSTELSALGLKMYNGKIAGVWAIGLVAIALSFAGRVGSGMASEIGAMVIGHQVDILSEKRLAGEHFYSGATRRQIRGHQHRIERVRMS